MVPNPYGLYDETVRSRSLWALREGLVVGAILLFWGAIAVALTVALFVISVPFLFLGRGSTTLTIVSLVWTLVGPLAFLNGSLYVLVRAGTVILDHHQSGDGLTFEPARGANETAERTEANTDVDPTERAEGNTDVDQPDGTDDEVDENGGDTDETEGDDG